MSKAQTQSSPLPRRIAAMLGMLAFSLSLLGGLESGNTFTTTVARALIAMVGTFAVGLILGAMAQKMIDENLAETEKKLRQSSMQTPVNDR